MRKIAIFGANGSLAKSLALSLKKKNTFLSAFHQKKSQIIMFIVK